MTKSSFGKTKWINDIRCCSIAGCEKPAQKNHSLCSMHKHRRAKELAIERLIKGTNINPQTNEEKARYYMRLKKVELIAMIQNPNHTFNDVLKLIKQKGYK